MNLTNINNKRRYDQTSDMVVTQNSNVSVTLQSVLVSPGDIIHALMKLPEDADITNITVRPHEDNASTRTIEITFGVVNIDKVSHPQDEPNIKRSNSLTDPPFGTHNDAENAPGLEPKGIFTRALANGI